MGLEMYVSRLSAVLPWESIAIVPISVLGIHGY